MSRRLEAILDWHALAESANYRASEMARRAQVSVRTLERHFLHHFGMTPEGWVEMQRMQKALLLCSRGEPIKTIALTLKFKHPSNFTTAFKRYFGVAPRDYVSRPPE